VNTGSSRASIVTALTIALLAAPALAGAQAAPKKRVPSVADGIEPTPLDDPVFPAPVPADRVRVWLTSHFVPPSDFGGVDLGLARPALRVRVQAPVHEKASVQLTGDFLTSVYDVDGRGPLFSDCPDCPSPDTFYSVTLAAQGG
jgi:hypothetical protein